MWYEVKFEGLARVRPYQALYTKVRKWSHILGAIDKKPAGLQVTESGKARFWNVSEVLRLEALC